MIQLSSDLENVSRYHCNIKYDANYGWIMYENADTPSKSGTWFHPKRYFQAKLSLENSPPVQLLNGMIIKAHSYSF